MQTNFTKAVEINMAAILVSSAAAQLPNLKRFSMLHKRCTQHNNGFLVQDQVYMPLIISL